MTPLPQRPIDCAGAADAMALPSSAMGRPKRGPRRWGCAAALGLIAGLVLGCGTVEPPSTLLYRLPLAASADPGARPATERDARVATSRAGPLRWQLLQPIELPELIDRDALVLPQGRTGVLRPSGHQWAEPLREAVPRVLWHDLSQRLGAASGVLGQAPPGWPVQAQMRLSLLALESAPDQATVRLVARWSIASPTGESPARLGQATVVAPVSGSGPQALVQAHRDALHTLAGQLADGLQRWPAP